MSKKYAYVTLATTESFLKGAHLLAYSLQRVNSKFPLIIMVTENLKPLLEDQYNYKIIPYYKLNNSENRTVDCLNKLQCLNFIEYDRLFFLDADIFVLKNLDYIFEEYNYDFFAGIKIMNGKKFLNGSKVLYTPKAGLFNSILNNKQLMSYSNEEPILISLFKDFYDSFDEVSFNLEREDIIHFSGEKKYWEIFNFNFSYLDGLSLKEIGSCLNSLFDFVFIYFKYSTWKDE